MTGLSLFSGIGGLDLAFEWAGGTVTAMCEIDPFCRKVLRKHWPDVPLFGDVKEVKGADVGAIDVVYGGFPCQPFSLAGDRKGRDDTRYLWPEFSRLVGEIGPRWIVAENVPGILSIAADDVCQDLERLGYCVGVWNFEALAVGAPHRRARIFFVAHAGRGMRQRCAVSGEVRGIPKVGATIGVERSGGPSLSDGEIICRNDTGVEEAGEHQGHFKAGRFRGLSLSDAYSTGQLQPQGHVEELRGRSSYPCNEDIADADSQRCEEQRNGIPAEQKLGGAERRSQGKPKPGLGGGFDGVSPWLDGDWENGIPRVSRGVPDRVARLKALGNAVVPQQAYPIFRAIAEIEKEATT